MTRLIAILCCGAVMVACHGSNTSGFLPTAPTVTTQPPPPPAPPVANPGPGPTLGSALALSPGQLVEASIAPTDPACFVNWDATGRCRQFDITAARDGVLDLWLGWSDPLPASIMTLFVVRPDGSWFSSPDSVLDVYTTVSVSAGSTYHLVVMSYSAPQDFQLMAALLPN